MELRDREILDFIKAKSDHPMKMKELARALEISRPDYARFRNRVKSLIDSGELVKISNGRIGLASEMNVLVGKIVVTRSGTGFVEREGELDDVLIPQSLLLTAFDGDKVMVRLAGRTGGRETGSVIKIVERTGNNIVGLFRQGRNFSTVLPDNPRIHRELYIPPDETLDACDGEKVVAVLIEWDDPHRNPEGAIKERLGLPGKGKVDMMAVIRGHNLPLEFPDDVLAEADKIAGQSFEQEISRRLDLTSESIYTIDPADAKDHDDAVSVEKTADGWKLGVHIADVSYFVRPGSSIDKEAFTRGNSVYLPGMVIPMLPEILSNDLCSLKVGKVRLANSAIIKFDTTGKMISWRRVDTVIKSKAKLSYEEVQEFFDGKETSVRTQHVRDNLTNARELGRLLNKRRCENGSLDFDLPESLLVLDEQGEVIKLGNRVRTEAHRLVEEFMLVANQAMALEVFRAGEKMLYRVHDRPDMEKLEAFAAMMSRLGHKFVVSKEIKPKSLAKFLDRVKDTPEADFINELMLRSMQKAVYQSGNLGHFGLAFSHYTHFTSPIRRYPDLLVHRLTRALKNNKYPPAFARRIGPQIDQVGRYCSETERVAERAERAAIKIKQAAYMARHLGDEFDGIITGVTGYGFYVRLSELGAEGMVKLSSMDDDYYFHDEKQFRLVGRRRGMIFRLGDQIRVGIQKVDTDLSEIDLFVVHGPKAKKKSIPFGVKSKRGRKVVKGIKVAKNKTRRKKKARK